MSLTRFLSWISSFLSTDPIDEETEELRMVIDHNLFNKSTNDLSFDASAHRF